MLKSTIVDTRIRLRPSKKVLEFLAKHKEHFDDAPANLAQILKKNGYKLLEKTTILKDSEISTKRPAIDTKLLAKLTSNVPDLTATEESEQEEEQEELEDEKPQPVDGSYLYLTDLHWLHDVMIKLRAKDITNVFLHELIESCELILPENEFKPRNPELEARCQRLREQQQNREYQKMTKNVDATLQHYPEDTIAYQLKSINKQIIAVAQFIFSVAAGFTFGFFGVNLMVGPLPFGFRILLGVIVALVIALAEMYFLAKKLHEYDEVFDAPKRKQAEESVKSSGVQKVKPHIE
ncbi:transmembrane protein 199 [Drosophila sulfurigaster albostrigata]|uniref:transmembrane protein 199 n=1 Tax=Drosophila sulfurigaster albostrigata TaxID=89887 RepID=UPI002D21C533|nr:transmembrane protein 199 [Drosophila sulfurigaster albostrigata]